MKHSPQIIEELYQVAPLLAKADKKNVFITQHDYFNLLSDRLIDRLTATSVYKLASSETLFSAPKNYFSQLPGHILARIRELENNAAQNDMEEISPLLSSLKNTNVFFVDQNYFSDFTIPITPEAPVIKMQHFNRFWKYAFAAAIAGIVAVSALLVEDYNIKPATGSIASELRLAKSYKNSTQLNNAISNLSADDIINYLDQSSTTDDDNDLANSILEKELPSSEDYLTNENTLNNYLDRIEVKSLNN